MGIIIDGTTGIDLGHTPVNNGTNYEIEGTLSVAGVTTLNGNIGVGTNSPGKRLDIVSLNNNSMEGVVRINSNNVAVHTDLAYDGINCSSQFQIRTENTTPLLFGTNSTERMRIDSAGNVGIGTSAIEGKLHIGGTVAGATQAVLTNGASDPNYKLFVSNGVAGSADGVLQASIRLAYSGVGYGPGISFTRGGGATNGSLLLETSGLERMRIDSNGNVLVTGSGGLGYGTGSGGTVTQLTSKSTAVTLNKPTGSITTSNAALSAGAIVTFTFNNSLLNVGDDVYVVPIYTGSGAWNYVVTSSDTTTGSCKITIWNKSGSSLSEAIPINFKVFKGAIA